MSQSPPDVGAINPEVAAIRKEQAAQHRAQMAMLAKIHDAAASPARVGTKVVAANNRRVNHNNFFVPLGADAKFDEQWDNWVPLMKATLVHKKLKEELGKVIVQIINVHGRDLKLDDREIFLNAVLPIVAKAGKVRVSDATDDESDESDVESASEHEDEDEDADSPYATTPSRAAAKAAGAKAAEARRERAHARVLRWWNEQAEEEEQEACIKAFLTDEQIGAKLKEMVQKARSTFLYPMLKNSLQLWAPALVPVTADIAADQLVYKKSKTVYESIEATSSWPRACPLLFGLGPDDQPLFMYDPYDDDDHEEEEEEEEDPKPVHPFTAYVHAVARQCNIAGGDITPNLIAFLAYIANQVASAGNRKRGRQTTDLVRGDLVDHDQWNRGIARALKFMMDKKKCPTKNPLITPIQKKKKKVHTA